jgi:DNA-binding IclR family transcriptional regulator
VQAEALANLVQVTPHTITDPRRLERDLAEIRRRGYARATDEVTLGLVSIAVPIRPDPGPPVAALGVVTSAGRPRISQLVPVLQVAAAAIGRSLRRAGAGPG